MFCLTELSGREVKVRWGVEVPTCVRPGGLLGERMKKIWGLMIRP